MKKNSSKARFYLKGALIVGAVGWATLFISGGLPALGHIQAALYMGLFSLFIGWVVSGYFWLMLGIIEGESLIEIILHKKKRRYQWYKTKRR